MRDMGAALAGLLLVLGGDPVAGQGVQVLDTLVVSPATHPDLPLREVSGLAHDAATGRLYAVSDRNDLFVLDLDMTGDRIGLGLVARHRLTGRDGQRLRRTAFAAEGVALTGAGLLIVSESPPGLVGFDRAGAWLHPVALPPGLDDPARLRSARNGLESLALHADLGPLVGPETPLAGTPRRVHVLHGAGGPAVAWSTGAGPATNLKALEALPDGTLLAIERHDGPEPGTFVPLLRRIDPAACRPEAPCAPPALPLPADLPADADYEGLAWLGGDRLMIASDDRIDGVLRTVLVLMAMP